MIISNNNSPVSINGLPLKPAPYVSTSYEYNKSGEYIIGGFLIVTLTGSIVGTDMSGQIDRLRSLQTESNCIQLTIGCSGPDFLSGAGRIRAVTINPSDQPYLSTYSIQIALELVDGKPAVDPDPEFLRQTCLDTTGIQNLSFVKSYSETINIIGEANVIASVDNVLRVSKSYIKISGKISLSSFMREVCGLPSYNGLNNSILIIQTRALRLMGMNDCIVGSPLSEFATWNKWLDTKSLTISGDGNVEWTFDIYASKGPATPIAWIDITTEDNQNQKRQTLTKTISGTIRGLSSASLSDYLQNKVNVNERISNASAAYNTISGMISTGSWPSDGVMLTGEEISPDSSGGPQGEDDKTCAPDPQNQTPGTCTQRISSTVKTSVVSGEITFNAEYGPIDSCKQVGIGTIEKTKEEELSVARHVEYIVPGTRDSLIIDIGSPTPAKATITVRGSLSSCELTVNNRNTLIGCVDREFNTLVSELDGLWLGTNEVKSIGTYSYSRTKNFVRCG